MADEDCKGDAICFEETEESSESSGSSSSSSSSGSASESDSGASSDGSDNEENVTEEKGGESEQIDELHIYCPVFLNEIWDNYD